MKRSILSILALACAGLTSFADPAADTIKPGAGTGAHGGTGADAGHSQPSTPAAGQETTPDRKSPPAIDGTKPEGHGAGPDVTTGQGGSTGPAPAPGTGTSAAGK